MDNEFKRMFKKIKFDEIIAYLLYEGEADDKRSETYEKRVNNSYDEFFSGIKKLFPSASRGNDDLWNVLLDFSTTHDEVYFEMGIIIGFQIYKNLDEGYGRLEANNATSIYSEKILKSSKIQKNGLLKELFGERMQYALEVVLKEDENYQKAVEISSEKHDRLNTIGLNKYQWKQVDRAISAANALGAEYGRVAYRLGFQDSLKLASELYGML